MLNAAKAHARFAVAGLAAAILCGATAPGAAGTLDAVRQIRHVGENR